MFCGLYGRVSVYGRVSDVLVVPPQCPIHIRNDHTFDASPIFAMRFFTILVSLSVTEKYVKNIPGIKY